MIEEEIPREQWQGFCDQFSRQHYHWLVTINVIETPSIEADPALAETQARLLASDLPFQGIACDQKGQGIELAIIAGEGRERITHLLCDPLRIRFEHTEDGAHKGLRIDRAAKETILVRFRAAVPPETVDGIAAFEH